MNRPQFNEKYPCTVCDRLHALRQCTRFLSMNWHQKTRIIRCHQLCQNCLAHSHLLSACRSLDRCRRCFARHHSLVHPMPDTCIWFLMTAQVKVFTWPGRRPQEARVLIDPNRFVSSIMAEEADRMFCVVNHGRTNLILCHRTNDRRDIRVTCVVESLDYGYSPSARIDRNWNLPHLPNAIGNADPDWYQKRRYTIILGQDVANEIFIDATAARAGKIYSQETVFGQAYFGEGKVMSLDQRLQH